MCKAVSMGVDELAVLDNGDRCGGNAGLLEDLCGDAVDTGFECGIERVDRLCVCANGAGEEQAANEKAL